MSFSTVLNTSKPTNTSTPVSISHSKLSANHPQLAKDIEILLNEAQRLGASVGVQRIAFVCDQYDKLTPDNAYHWIDPVGLQNEIEDTQANKSEMWHIVRNCVSLLPLIFTWFALFSAASSYQNCLAAHQCEVTTPFLALWQQDGFASRTFTFASAALLDVFLLLTYLLLIIITFWLDRRAHITSIVFAKKLQGTTESLMKVIADEGITPLASEADVDKVSHAVQQVVDKAVEMSKQVARNAEESSQRAIQGTQAMSQQAIQAAQQSTQQALQSAQQSMQEIVQTAQQAVQASQLGVQQVIQDSHQATQQLVQSTQQAIADSNSKVEDLYTKQPCRFFEPFL